MQNKVFLYILFNIKNIISINNSEWVLKKKTKTVSATIRDVACPFCGLLCDDLIIENKKENLKVLKNGCPKAIFGFEQEIPENFPKVKGKKTSIENME